MSLPAVSLIQAAQAFAGAQDYPKATLYMVATPIGNRADIAVRALHVLALCDRIACEDTRHTAALLNAYGLHRPLLAVHEHNEREAAETVLSHLRDGERVAYVSDAGTPGVSDPGARLVAAVQAAGLRCVPLPGASSVTALLSVSALAGATGWRFAGFLPAKGQERQRALQAIAADPQACVLLEAPHRIETLARELADALGARALTVGRELTKQHEELVHLPAADWPAWLAADANHRRGEFVLLVHAAEPAPADGATGLDGAALRTLELLLTELPLKAAVRLAVQITGAPRNALYEAALRSAAQRTSRA